MCGTNQSILRKNLDRKRFVIGKALYTDDIHLSDMAYLALVRSPYAHARILNINFSDIEHKPAILMVMPNNELCVPRLSSKIGTHTISFDFIATRKVKYAGQPVAAVVAESIEEAEDALEYIQVEYEPLPALLNVEEAFTSNTLIYDELGTNIILSHSVHKGNVEEAFKEADVTIEEKFVLSRQAGSPLEPRSVIAVFDEKTLDVYMCVQNPFMMRSVLSNVLGIEEEKISVIVPDVGGAFGTKNSFYPEPVLASLASIRLRRPVKWTESRLDNLLAAYHGRGHVHKVKAAARRDGKILAFQDEFLIDGGALAIITPTALFSTMRHLIGCYKIDNFQLNGYVICTNKSPTGPVRGNGRPEATFVIERTVDLLARELGIDPAEIRFKNFIQSNEFPYDVGNGSTYDSGNYSKLLEIALESSEYYKYRKIQTELREKGRYIGIGIGCYVEIGGSSAGASLYVRDTSFESCRISVNESGKVTVVTGAINLGQGLETILAKLTSAELGVSLENIEVYYGSTDLITDGVGTYGSRSLVTSIGALKLALDTIKEKILLLAENILKTSRGNLIFESGEVYDKTNPKNRISLGDLAKASRTTYQNIGPLDVITKYVPKGFTSSSGVHIAISEVDVETGQVKVLDYYIVDDCGRIMDPKIVEGQIIGGLAFGISNVLLEQIVYDNDGKVTNASLMDYLILTSMEAVKPIIKYYETPSPFTIYGVKGIGEGATMGAFAAITNSIEDALRPLGVRITEIPINSEKIHGFLKDKI